MHVYIYVYMVPPPMYPHFCGILIINLEVKTCFMFWCQMCRGVPYIYIYIYFNSSFGFDFLLEVLKVLKLLGTKN